MALRRGAPAEIDPHAEKSQWPLRPVSLRPVAKRPRVSRWESQWPLRPVSLRLTPTEGQTTTPRSQWPLRPVSLRQDQRTSRQCRVVSLASAAGVAATPSTIRTTFRKGLMASAAGVAATRQARQPRSQVPVSMASSAGVAATATHSACCERDWSLNGLCGRCRCDRDQACGGGAAAGVSMASAAGVAATPTNQQGAAP